MKKYKKGYTTGVYDLFHIGHLNLLKRAKEYCDYLVVGVTVDELVSYKNKKAVIPFEERREIVESIKYVDEAIAQTDLDKVAAWDNLHFDVLFVGSDWQGKPNWVEYEKRLAEKGVDVVYFPYTQNISSTKLRDVLNKIDLGEAE